MLNWHTDGIIFFASEFEPVHAEMLTETLLPLVVVDSRLLEQPINSVTVESMCSVYQALKYLYDLGHRRIGFLTADEATGALPERQNAFYLCQKRLGLSAASAGYCYGTDFCGACASGFSAIFG